MSAQCQIRGVVVDAGELLCTCTTAGEQAHEGMTLELAKVLR